jgi:hypothetical protein
VFTKAKRKLLAESLTKAAEYIFALIILGQFIGSGKVSVYGILASIITYALLVLTAMFVVPDEKESER